MTADGGQGLRLLGRLVEVSMLPLTYAAALAMMTMAGLLAYADLVNPLTLTN
ncbi:hypothetical protein ACFYUK_42330 [Nonomuraea wenchangensis]